MRQSFMYDVDATAFDLQPLSAGTGSTGLIPIDGAAPFTSDILADYEFGGPCI